MELLLLVTGLALEHLETLSSAGGSSRGPSLALSSARQERGAEVSALLTGWPPLFVSFAQRERRRTHRSLYWLHWILQGYEASFERCSCGSKIRVRQRLFAHSCAMEP